MWSFGLHWSGQLSVRIPVTPATAPTCNNLKWRTSQNLNIWKVSWDTTWIKKCERFLKKVSFVNRMLLIWSLIKLLKRPGLPPWSLVLISNDYRWSRKETHTWEKACWEARPMKLTKWKVQSTFFYSPNSKYQEGKGLAVNQSHHLMKFSI